MLKRDRVLAQGALGVAAKDGGALPLPPSCAVTPDGRQIFLQLILQIRLCQLYCILLVFLRQTQPTFQFFLKPVIAHLLENIGKSSLIDFKNFVTVRTFDIVHGKVVTGG
jgi:hypothetical protein